MSRLKLGIALIFFLSMLAIAQQPVSLTRLADYWHLVASYHAQNAALEKSYTSMQKAMQEKLSDLSSQIESVKLSLAQECKEHGGNLKIDGNDVTCSIEDKYEEYHQ